MSDNPADRAPPQHLQAPLALAVAAPCADLAAAAVQEAAAAVQARLQRLAASRQRAQEAADARSFAADLMVTGGAASTSTPTSSPNRATAATPRLGARGRGRVRLNSLATINSRGRLPSGSSAAGAYYRLPLHRRWLQECSLLPAGLPASLFSPFCWAPRSERCRTGEGATGQPEGGGDTTGTQADEAGIDPIARGRGRGPVGSEVALVWDLRAHSSSRGKKCFIFHRFATRPHQVVQAVTIGGFRCVSKDVVARNPESDEPRTAGSNPAAASQDRQAENENRAVDGSKGSDRNAGSVLGTPEQSVHVYPVEPQPGDVVVAVVRHGLSVPLIGHDVATTVIPELKGMMDPPRAKRGIPSTNTSGRDVVPAQLVMLRPRVVWCTVITLQSVVTLRSPACTDPVDRADFEGNNKPEQSQDDGLTTARFMLVCIMMEELLKTMLQRCTVGRSCNAGVADSIEFVRVDCGCTGKLASTTHAASNPRLHQQAFRVTVKWLRPRRPRDQSKEHLPNGANGDTCTGRNDANDFCGDDSDASTSARSRSAFRTKIVDRLAESIAAYAALLQVPGKMRGVDTVPLVDVSTASNVKAACQPFSRDLLGTVYGWPAEAMDDADPCSPNSADGLPTSQPEAVSSAEGPATGECGISSSAPGRSQIELASEPVAPETLDSLVRRPRSRTEGPEGLALFPGPVAKIVGTKKESYGKSRKYTLELVPPQQKRGTLPMPPPLTFDFYLENLELLRTTVVAQFKHSHHVLPLPRAHSSRGNESKPQGGWGAKLPSSALQRRGSTGTTGNFFRDRHRHQQLLKSGGTKFSSPFSKKDRLVSRIAGIEDFMENECCSRSEVLLSIPFKQFVLHCGVAPGMWETWQAFLKSELAPVAEHFSTASAKRDSQAGSVGGTGSPTNSPPPPRSSLSPDTMEKATSMLIPAPPCTYDVEYPDNLQFTVEAGNMALKHGRMVEVRFARVCGVFVCVCVCVFAQFSNFSMLQRDELHLNPSHLRASGC
eukprot:INCI5879.3.p1 GENE.INCI5879.3~~INCI5879.3.p1  ORF type:complete len:1060 (+),score=144.29 INCI5879.3:178-3180(+)